MVRLINIYTVCLFCYVLIGVSEIRQMHIQLSTTMTVYVSCIQIQVIFHVPVYHIVLYNRRICWSTLLNSSTTEMQRKKILVCKFSKNTKSKLYHIENSKTRGQTV